MDPFEARLTFTVERDSLTVTIDDDLSVTDVTWDSSVEPER